MVSIKLVISFVGINKFPLWLIPIISPLIFITGDPLNELFKEFMIFTLFVISSLSWLSINFETMSVTTELSIIITFSPSSKFSELLRAMTGRSVSSILIIARFVGKSILTNSVS